MTCAALPLVTSAATAGDLLAALLYLALLLVVCAGVGAAVAVLRVIVPGAAAAADRSLHATSARRLWLAGVVPLLAAAALGWALGAVAVPALHYAYLLLVALPLALALLLGGMAALPSLGERLLERGTPRSALARSVGGGVALGLAGTTALIPPLFALVALLVCAWLVGIGLGAALRA